MRLSSVLFGSVVFALAAASAGCTVSAQTKSRFTESNYVVTDQQAWAGEPIAITLPGVQFAVNSFVKVIADPGLADGKITANARVLAMANSDDEANAILTRNEVKNTFVIAHTGAGDIEITCGQGTTHGTSAGSTSGCEAVEIHVPVGSLTQKLNVTITTGNAPQTLDFHSAFVASVTSHANGSISDITMTAPTTDAAMQGGAITLTSHTAGDITATLPTTFSADTITIEADPDKLAFGPFTDITNVGGGKTQPRGTLGVGLKSLGLNSEQYPADESGHITLVGE